MKCSERKMLWNIHLCFPIWYTSKPVVVNIWIIPKGSLGWTIWYTLTQNYVWFRYFNIQKNTLDRLYHGWDHDGLIFTKSIKHNDNFRCLVKPAENTLPVNNSGRKKLQTLYLIFYSFIQIVKNSCLPDMKANYRPGVAMSSET